jgi:HlyD family type I secretion membrane fusion protein
VGGPAAVGITILLGFFGSLIAWSVYAPLSGAVIAVGSIAPEGATRVVQHLEGGIIEQILVKEGDRVHRGAPLVRLKDVRARSQYDILKSHAYQFALVEKRLLAEQRGDAEWRPARFPQDQAELEAVQVQERMFDLNRRALHEEGQMLGERIAELEAAIAMMQNQIRVDEKQRALNAREFKMVDGLYKQGLMPLPRLLQLQRHEAEVEGAYLARKGNIERSKAQIAYFRTQIKNVETKYYARISKELEENALKQVEVTRKFQEAEDILRRTIIFAPVEGTVTQLRHRTLGAVLQPGEPLLYLVPSEESLVVEARIRPIDIDAVGSDQEAQVRLLAYNQRTFEPLRAKIDTISPDLVTDQRSGERYYLARLAIDSASAPGRAGGPADQGGSPRLTAGMPVEVMIATGPHSIIRYMIAPIADVFRRSLRET